MLMQATLLSFAQILTIASDCLNLVNAGQCCNKICRFIYDGLNVYYYIANSTDWTFLEPLYLYLDKLLQCYIQKGYGRSDSMFLFAFTVSVISMIPLIFDYNCNADLLLFEMMVQSQLGRICVIREY